MLTVLCWQSIKVPNLFGSRDQIHGRQFFLGLCRVGVGGGGRVVSGCFKRITFIVHFISIMITSAPPQVIRHLEEIGKPCDGFWNLLKSCNVKVWGQFSLLLPVMCSCSCYVTLLTSYPIPSPHLLHDFIVVYTQRGVSRRKKVGQDCCLSSFTPCLGWEVDSERTSWAIWNVMMGIYPDIFRRNPLPEVIFILSALAKYPCHVHQQEFWIRMGEKNLRSQNAILYSF